MYIFVTWQEVESVRRIPVHEVSSGINDVDGLGVWLGMEVSKKTQVFY